MAKKKNYEDLQEEFIQQRAENRGWEELSVDERQRLASRFDVLAQSVQGRGKIARTIYGESPENQPSRREARRTIKAGLPKPKMASANESTPQVTNTNNNQSSPSTTSTYRPPSTSNSVTQKTQTSKTVDDSPHGWAEGYTPSAFANWAADTKIPIYGDIFGAGIPGARMIRPAANDLQEATNAFGESHYKEGFKNLGQAALGVGLGALDVGFAKALGLGAFKLGTRAALKVGGTKIVSAPLKYLDKQMFGGVGAAASQRMAQSRGAATRRTPTVETAPASSSAVVSSTERVAATSAETRLATTETATTPTPAAGSAPKATGGQSAPKATGRSKKAPKASDQTRNVTVTEVAPTQPATTASPVTPPAAASTPPIAPPTAGGTAPTSPHVQTRTPEQIITGTTPPAATTSPAPKGKGKGKGKAKPKDEAVIEEVKPVAKSQPTAEEVVGGTNPKAPQKTKPSTSSPTKSSPSVTESKKKLNQDTQTSASVTAANTAQSSAAAQPKAPKLEPTPDTPVGYDPAKSPAGSVLPRGEQAAKTTVDPELQKLIDAIPDDPVIPELPKLSKKEIRDLTPEQLRARADLKKQRAEAQALARKYTDMRKAMKDVERIEYVINPQTGLPVINPQSGTPWRRIIYKKPSQLQQEKLQRQAERAAERAKRRTEEGLGEGVVVEEVGETAVRDYNAGKVTMTDARTGEVLSTPEQNQKFFEAARTKDGYPDTVGGQELKQREAIAYSEAYDQYLAGVRTDKPTSPVQDARAEGWKKVVLTAEEAAEEAAKTPKQRRRERLAERSPRPRDPEYDAWIESLSPEQLREHTALLEREFERKRAAGIPDWKEGRTPKQIEQIEGAKAEGARLAKKPEQVAAEKAEELVESKRTRANLILRRIAKNPKTRKRMRQRELERKPAYPPDDGRQPLHSFSRNNIKETLREGTFYDQINAGLESSGRTTSTHGSTLMDELAQKQKAILEQTTVRPKAEGVESFVSKGMDYETLLNVEQQFDLQQIRTVNAPYGRTRPVKEAVFVKKPNAKGEVVPMKKSEFEAMTRSYEMTREDLLRLLGTDLGRK